MFIPRCCFVLCVFVVFFFNWSQELVRPSASPLSANPRTSRRWGNFHSWWSPAVKMLSNQTAPHHVPAKNAVARVLFGLFFSWRSATEPDCLLFAVNKLARQLQEHTHKKKNPALKLNCTLKHSERFFGRRTTQHPKCSQGVFFWFVYFCFSGSCSY